LRAVLLIVRMYDKTAVHVYVWIVFLLYRDDEMDGDWEPPMIRE